MEQSDAPATKGDLEATAAMSQETQQFRLEFRQRCAELKQIMRDGQTELLKAFYSFAHRIDAKLTDSDIADISLRQRLSAVESRLLEIEKRLNMPPAA